MKKILLFTLLLLSYSTATSVKTQKNNYTLNELIKIDFSDMLGHQKDWIGIYRLNDNNDWNNVLRWNWTNSRQNGTLLKKLEPNNEIISVDTFIATGGLLDNIRLSSE